MSLFRLLLAFLVAGLLAFVAFLIMTSGIHAGHIWGLVVAIVVGIVVLLGMLNERARNWHW